MIEILTRRTECSVWERNKIRSLVIRFLHQWKEEQKNNDNNNYGVIDRFVMKFVDCFPRADSIYCHHNVVEDRFWNNTIYVDAMHALCNTSLCHYRNNSLDRIRM